MPTPIAILSFVLRPSLLAWSSPCLAIEVSVSVLPANGEVSELAYVDVARMKLADVVLICAEVVIWELVDNSIFAGRGE